MHSLRPYPYLNPSTPHNLYNLQRHLHLARCCQVNTLPYMMAKPYIESSSSNMIGDYIGMESCIHDLCINEEEEKLVLGIGKDFDGYYSSYKKRNHEKRCMIKEKVFPPPIPCLARTENLHPRMPWVLKRYYTDDGRLVLREERVERHEYFEACRANDRLTLQLIPLDGDGADYDDDGNDLIVDPTFGENDTDEEADDKVTSSEDESETDGEANKEKAVGESSTPNCNGVIAGNMKCLSYGNVRKISPCLFEVPSIRPIHG